MYAQLLALLPLLQVALSSPVPRLITRVHTAEPVTTTATYTTGTTTVHLPPVQLFISNGVTYTWTLTDQATATEPTTTTSVYNDPTSTAAADNNDSNSNADNNNNSNADNNNNSNADSNGEGADNNSPADDSTPQSATNAQNDDAQPTTTSADTTPQTSSPAAADANTPAAETTSTDAAETTSTDAPETTSTESAETTSIESPETTSTDATSAETTSPSSSESGLISPPTAIVYSPYTNNGGCKDADTIDSDLELIHSKGINRIRTYGCDCGSISDVLPKAAQLGIKVNQGFWFGKGQIDNIDSDVEKVINYGQENGWDVFDFITVGNEAINDNFATVDELTSKISSVKSKLNDAGYSGQITTSEPPVSYLKNPGLCTNSDIDFAGINPHSYFNTQFFAKQAGSFVKAQKKLVEAVCGSKSVFITETGYPHQGNANGNNVPSPENQKLAVQSIIDELDGDVTILSTFDDPWKPAGDYNVERYFGTIDILS